MATTPQTQSVLGTGLKFPFGFNGTAASSVRGVAESSEIDRVTESIQHIMGVKRGTRFMRRDFGSDLRDLVFSPIQPEFDLIAEHMIREAFGRWEHRAVLGQIDFDRTRRAEGRVDIQIEFQVIKTQQVGNYVYPFYLSGASASDAPLTPLTP